MRESEKGQEGQDHLRMRPYELRATLLHNHRTSRTIIAIVVRRRE